MVLSARRQAELEETAKLCSGETHIVAGDVTKEEDVKKLFEETITKFGMYYHYVILILILKKMKAG